MLKNNLRKHSEYVLRVIHQRINRRSSQEKGACYISARWFREQGLDEQETTKIFDILNNEGYEVDVNKHFNTWFQSEREDILITW